MVVKILVVADPVHKLKPKSDSTFAFVRAAAKRGDEIFWADSTHIALWEESVRVLGSRVLAAEAALPPRLEKERRELPVDQFDSIWIRKDPPFDSNYVNLCWLLSLVEQKVRVVNSPSLLLQHHEKLLPYQALNEGYLRKQDLFPTLVSAGTGDFRPASFPRGIVVAKPWLGYGGRGVQKFRSLAEAFRLANTKDFLMYQPYLKNVRSVGDRRVIFFEGEVVGDFVRIPPSKSFVANLAQGGSAILRERSKRESELCDRIGSFLRAKKILFAGVDLLGDKLTEINITSPTGIQAYFELSGVDLSPKYLSMIDRYRI